MFHLEEDYTPTGKKKFILGKTMSLTVNILVEISVFHVGISEFNSQY